MSSGWLAEAILRGGGSEKDEQCVVFLGKLRAGTTNVFARVFFDSGKGFDFAIYSSANLH